MQPNATGCSSNAMNSPQQFVLVNTRAWWMRCPLRRDTRATSSVRGGHPAGKNLCIRAGALGDWPATSKDPAPQGRTTCPGICPCPPECIAPQDAEEGGMWAAQSSSPRLLRNQLQRVREGLAPPRPGQCNVGRRRAASGPGRWATKVWRGKDRHPHPVATERLCTHASSWWQLQRPAATASIADVQAGLPLPAEQWCRGERVAPCTGVEGLLRSPPVSTHAGRRGCSASGQYCDWSTWPCSRGSRSSAQRCIGLALGGFGADQAHHFWGPVQANLPVVVHARGWGTTAGTVHSPRFPSLLPQAPGRAQLIVHSRAAVGPARWPQALQ